MISNFVVYDADGKILRTGSCPDDMALAQTEPGESVMIGHANDITDYVLNGEIVPRPANPTTLTGNILNNVPVPAVVGINRVDYVTGEPTIELSFDQSTTYQIKVVAFPYLDAKFTVIK